VVFAAGGSIKWLAVAPQKWSRLSEAGGQLAAGAGRYASLFLVWAALFGAGAAGLGSSVRRFLPAFLVIFITTGLVYFLGLWDQAAHYNLEPPLVALGLGLLISNAAGVPRWMEAALRVELYIKTGIVLLGASLPVTLLAWAGPVAMLQAAIVSLATFGVIYFCATRLGLDRRLAATLGTGGAVCGVSGAIAIGGAVGAKKQDISVAISLVVAWAIVMIFVLPLVSRALGLPTGVAGAWIGTSEFADAAGLAAAQTYGGYAGSIAGITGHADSAVTAFTLMKVIGRDVWIGVWAFVLALLAATRWEPTGIESRPSFAPGHRFRERLRLRGLQEGGHPGLGRPAAGVANLGIHVRVPEHRAQHALARVPRRGRPSLHRVHARRVRQRAAGLFSVDSSFRRLLAGTRAVNEAPVACAACGHFNNHPADLESQLPALRTLSSAYAAVRSSDGVCALHQRYVAASSACGAYTASTSTRQS
jgi:uncharacterized membrane protein YadS